MIDTNTLALAQQMQDIKDGYLALKSLLGGVAVGGVISGGKLRVLLCCE